MGKKIRVHIADDHKILIEGIYAVIKSSKEIEIEGYSLDGREVIEWSKTHMADVLVLDINMPLFDGVEVLKSFKLRGIDIKVIILSSYDDVNLVKEMMQLGASGFLSKDSASKHIVDAIKAVYNGEQYFSDAIKNNLLKLYMGKEVRLGERPESTIAQNLTRREVEILGLLTKEYSSLEIAKLLNLSKATVDTYRKNLFKKIKAKNVVGLAMYAVKNKIVSIQ